MHQRKNNKFKSEFILAAPKANISKMILTRIVQNSHESIDTKKGDAWLEHIMPQKATKGEWIILKQSDEELYNFSINRIGNLTLLLNKLNQGASNKDFNIKKDEYYKESRLKITTGLLSYDIWNFDSVDKRQEDLYEEAKNVWSFQGNYLPLNMPNKQVTPVQPSEKVIKLNMTFEEAMKKALTTKIPSKKKNKKGN